MRLEQDWPEQVRRRLNTEARHLAAEEPPPIEGVLRRGRRRLLLRAASIALTTAVVAGAIGWGTLALSGLAGSRARGVRVQPGSESISRGTGQFRVGYIPAGFKAVNSWVETLPELNHSLYHGQKFNNADEVGQAGRPAVFDVTSIVGYRLDLDQIMARFTGGPDSAFQTAERIHVRGLDAVLIRTPVEDGHGALGLKWVEHDDVTVEIWAIDIPLLEVLRIAEGLREVLG